MKRNNKIIILGNLKPLHNDKIHQRNWIYSIWGVCCSMTATMYKDPPRIIERLF
jgi:hypothetical protein